MFREMVLFFLLSEWGSVATGRVEGRVSLPVGFEQILKCEFFIKIYIVSTFPSFLRLGGRNALFSLAFGF